MIDTTVAPGAAHPLVPQLQGPFARARARQINYQVPSFVGKNSKKIFQEKSNPYPSWFDSIPTSPV
jgi:hypothetical protein